MEDLATADVAQAAAGAASVLAGITAVWPEASAAGPAYPCACEPGDNLALHRALTQAPPGSVVVCDAGGDASCAYAGELMALEAQARGLAGLVVDGAVRDTSVLRDVGLPVFAAGACPLSPAKAAARTVGEEIVVRGVPIRPGDLVVADRDGVLVLADADGIEAQVAAVRERERGIREAMTSGEPLARLLGVDGDL